jgi:hypothetical protein
MGSRRHWRVRTRALPRQVRHKDHYLSLARAIFATNWDSHAVQATCISRGPRALRQGARVIEDSRRLRLV